MSARSCVRLALHVIDCMIITRQNTARGFRPASRILLLCVIYTSYAVAAEPYSPTRFTELTTKAARPTDRKQRLDLPARQPQNIQAHGGDGLARDLKFTHLTTNDGLSQGYVTAILQDRRGFMWFATRDGLNRYDGNTFVVYKHNPNDTGTLSSNFLQDLVEDDHGYLWISTNSGVNKFDPGTERVTRYLHDPNNPNSLGGAYVTSIGRDGRGTFGLAPKTAASTSLIQPPEHSLIIEMTAMASLSGGSLTSSRVAIGISGLLASAVCSI